MKKKKAQPIERQEFVVFSEYGYFSGLTYGGTPQWSMNQNDAKPLNHMNKFYTLRSISHMDLMFEMLGNSKK